VGLLLAVMGAILVAYAAVFVSIPSALLVAAAVSGIGVFYVRRSRGHARVPRR
jgi:hypothetical protein